MAELFSVVTPVRNGMPSLPGAVRSVERQSGVRVQHLVRDANSTDGTSEWLTNYASISHYRGADSGMYDAINQGWREAHGTYVSWLNADEQYLEGALAKVASAFRAKPEIEVVYGDAIIVSPSGNPIAYRREAPPRTRYIANSFLYLYSCTLFYRRSLLDAGVLMLDSELKYAADMDLVLRLIRSGVRFYGLREPIALYTASGANLSTHDGMRIETETVMARHGATRSKISRGLWRLARWAERFKVGGFASRTGTYAHYDGSADEPRLVEYKNLGTRYSVFDSNHTCPGK